MLTLSHLDSPIFMKMGGEKLKTLVARLGVREDESISHAMVTRAISNLQSKHDQKVVAERKANSIKDWYQTNLGD
jgi:preprotein translocase subunit SecA